MKFIKISAFAIVLLLLMQIVSKAFIAIDSSDIENIYGFYAEPKNSLDMVMIGPSEVYTGYAPALAWEEYGLKSCNLSIGAVPCNMYKSIVTEITKRQKPKLTKTTLKTRKNRWPNGLKRKPVRDAKQAIR